MPGGVTGAIARAAAATGVDFRYLLAQARLESGLDPQARARTSSARGLYQFTNATWLSALRQHGDALGLDGLAQAPATRADLLHLRDDPETSALMAGALASDNRAYLTGVLGRAPDNAELYLAHFLGTDGAARFLAALDSDPQTSAAALLPAAASANRAIFYAGDTPRSVSDVMTLLRGRLDAASGIGMADAAIAPGADFAAIAPAAPMGGPLAQEFAAAAAAAGNPPPAGSMADTLAATFGLGEGAAPVPDHVRAAYGRIRALGM